MHRSGTSLLGHLLEQLGLFLGAKKDKNNEALFFLKLNTWLMSQCGARWDHPKAMADLWREEATSVLEASRDYIKDLMVSPRFTEYLGMKKYIQLRLTGRLQYPWGWKDPRNTYTLPFWLSIFPNARVVFIERHGIDVAQSLRTRSIKSIKITTNRYKKFKSLAWLYPKKGGFCDSPRSLSIESGFKLWEIYQRQAQAQMENLSSSRVFRVRYEELLSDPNLTLKSVAKFCNLPISGGKINKATKLINSGRAYSYQSNLELVQLAEALEGRLIPWGYVR